MLRLDLIVPSQYIRSIMDEFLDSKKYIVVYLDDMAESVYKSHSKTPKKIRLFRLSKSKTQKKK